MYDTTFKGSPRGGGGGEKRRGQKSELPLTTLTVTHPEATPLSGGNPPFGSIPRILPRVSLPQNAPARARGRRRLPQWYHNHIAALDTTLSSLTTAAATV